MSNNKKHNKLIPTMLLGATIGVGLFTGCGKAGESNITNSSQFTYNINYVLYGATNDKDNIETYKNGDKFTFKAPTKNGYKFVNWYTDENFEHAITEINDQTKGHLNLYAKFVPIEYTIDYDLQGGTLSKENPSSYNIDTPNFTLVNPTKKGYDFVGWKNLDTNITSISQTFFQGREKGNRRYQALWILTKYDISVVSDHGQVTIANESQRGEPIVFSITPDKGYKVKSIKYNDTELDIHANTFKMPEGKVKFVVEYELEKYEIKLNTEGGHFPTGYTPITEYTILTETFTLPKLSKDGYTFLGWMEGGAQHSNSITISKGSTGNREYTASWSTANYYDLTSESKNGTVSFGGKVKATVEDTIVATITPNPGYEIDQVFINDKLTELDKSGKTITFPMRPENVVVKVTYKIIEYTIDYDLDGGTLGEQTNRNKYTVKDDVFTLKSPNKPGYVFKGWMDKETGKVLNSGNFYPNQNVGNKTYVAQWELEYNDIIVTSPYGEVEKSAITAQKGTTVNIKVTPNAGYEVVDIIVNNASIIKNGQVDKNNATFVMPEGDANLVVKYQPINYTITYDKQGGETSDIFKDSYTVTDEAFTLPSLTKTGYEFKGWIKEGEIDPVMVVTINPIDVHSNLKYTASFKAIDYKITTTIPSELGTITVANSGHYKDQITATITPIKGYRIKSILVNDIVVTIQDKDKIIFEMPAGEVNIKVEFEEEEYQITYSGIDGITINNPSTYKVTSQSFTLNNPSKKGYYFAGWKDLDKPESELLSSVTINTGDIGNRNFKAVWEGLNIIQNTKVVDNIVDLTITIENIGDLDFNEALGIRFQDTNENGEVKFSEFKLNGNPIDVREIVGTKFLGYDFDLSLNVGKTSTITAKGVASVAGQYKLKTLNNKATSVTDTFTVEETINYEEINPIEKDIKVNQPIKFTIKLTNTSKTDYKGPIFLNNKGSDVNNSLEFTEILANTQPVDIESSRAINKDRKGNVVYGGEFNPETDDFLGYHLYGLTIKAEETLTLEITAIAKEAKQYVIRELTENTNSAGGIGFTVTQDTNI